MKKYIYIGTVLLSLGLPLSLSLRDIHSKTRKSEGQSSFITSKIGQESMSTPTQSQRPISVSVVQLIANPQAYDGKYVRVIGFVSLAFEGTAVYLHQDDYKFGIFKNALWLDIAKADRRGYMEYDLKYVLVEGTFDAKETGHRGGFSGGIKNIERFQVQNERGV